MEFKNNITAILIISGTIVILLISSDPILFSDSSRYLKGHLKDPPLYSSIIFILQPIFKSLSSVVILQTVFVGFSIYYFSNTLDKIFKLDVLTLLVITSFLFLPFIKFYRYILTEPFSYGFSLLFISFVLKIIYNFKNINIFYFSIFVTALLLMRNQFIFLYPLILFFYLGIYFLNKTRKIFIILLFSFLSIVFTHNSLVILKNYSIKNDAQIDNVLKNDSGIYYFTYIDAIYISSVKDSKIFKNKKFHKTIDNILNEIDNQKASSKYYDGRGHYALSFDIIRETSTEFLVNLASEENLSVIEIKKEISIKLLRENFGSYIKLIFKKFYDSTWLFVFLPIFLIFASFISFLKNKSNLSFFTLFLSTFALANHTVVYLFGRVQPRYLIYSDFILLIFIFIVFTILLKKN